MITTANLVSINNRAILLVLKKDTWILPGGKHQRDESDADCLQREISEELPDANIEIGECYGDFDGKTPHSKEECCATVYLGSIYGDITPAEEISDSGYFDRRKLDSIKISEITKKIIDKLIEDNLL